MKWRDQVLLVLIIGGMLIVAGGARADSRIVAPSIDPEASCKVCHEDVVALRKRVADEDSHEGMECVECHIGRRFNPHLPPELEEDTLELVQSMDGYFERGTEAIAACADCHEDETVEWRDSIHGAGPLTDSGLQRPGCIDCHGSPHAVTTASQAKLQLAARCIKCHEFEPGEDGPASPHVVDTYRDTLHGKMLMLGNDAAASCGDCHTGHGIYAPDDPRSSVHLDNRAETCRQCHKNATDSFTAAISHRPHTIDADFWAWATALLFSVLTVGTIILLVSHAALDLLRAGRVGLRKPDEFLHTSTEGAVAADDEIQRFNIHNRLQHGMMILSFVTLAVTGWPLKSASLDVSGRLVQALGGQATLAVIHRSAGVLLIVVAVYHLFYLALRWWRGQLNIEMLPSPKDILDLVFNLFYFLGLREERPKFGKFTYYEKFDYWAVFWGIVVMVGSGLILWFPVWASRFLPGDFITIAFIAHSDEALLAALAIFLWHFYNVHLRPSVFPMSWVWLTGRITAEALYDEHRLEYEDRFGSAPLGAPRVHPTWHHKPLWSFAALAIVLTAAVAVVALDVSSVRQKLAALGMSPTPVDLASTQVGDSKVGGVYDKSFDPWETCFDCHSRDHYESNQEHFPHKLHFEEEELDSECTGCHDSKFHEKISTDFEDCLDCHEPEDIGLAQVEWDRGRMGMVAED